MKKWSAAVLAVIFCGGVMMLAVAFGYEKYRKGQREDAAFRQVLLEIPRQQQNAVLQARMPTQLPPHASSVLVGDTPPPPDKP